MSPKSRGSQRPPSSRSLPVLFSHQGTDYVRLRGLGTGSHGEELFLAQERTGEKTGALVEVAVLGPHASWKSHQRLVEEARLASLLSHPSIARVHGVHERQGTKYLIAEHVPGLVLDTVISYAVQVPTHLSEGFALHVAAEVAGALHHAHTLADSQGHALGILHRALSPFGIVVGHEGTVKLTDFASAYSRLPGREATTSGLLRGDVEYAAPERLCPELSAELDARSDLFSLGMVMLETLTGQQLYDLGEVERAAVHERPAPGGMEWREPLNEQSGWATLAELARRARAYRPEHVEHALRGVSAPVKAIVHKLLRRAPAERYQTAEELRADLHDAPRALGSPYSREDAAREVARVKAAAEENERKADPVELALGLRVRDPDDITTRG